MILEITEPLYKIRTYDGVSHYVQSSTLTELYHYIIKSYVLNGHHITSVCKVNNNGTTPKVSLFGNPEFKLILAQHQTYEQTLNIFDKTSVVEKAVMFDANSAQIFWRDKTGVIHTSILTPSKNAKKGYVVIDGVDTTPDKWLKERGC